MIILYQKILKKSKKVRKSGQKKPIFYNYIIFFYKNQIALIFKVNLPRFFKCDKAHSNLCVGFIFVFK